MSNLNANSFKLSRIKIGLMKYVESNENNEEKAAEVAFAQA